MALLQTGPRDVDKKFVEVPKLQIIGVLSGFEQYFHVAELLKLPDLCNIDGTVTGMSFTIVEAPGERTSKMTYELDQTAVPCTDPGIVSTGCRVACTA